MSSTKFPWTPNQNHEQPKFLLTRLAKMVIKPKKSSHVKNFDMPDGPNSLPFFTINGNENCGDVKNGSADYESVRHDYYNTNPNGFASNIFTDGPLSLPYINSSCVDEESNEAYTIHSSESERISNSHSPPYKISWDDACGVDVDNFDDEIPTKNLPPNMASNITPNHEYYTTYNEVNQTLVADELPYKSPNYWDVNFDNDYNEIAHHKDIHQIRSSEIHRKSIPNFLPYGRYNDDYDDGYERIQECIPNRLTSQHSKYSNVGSSIPNIIPRERIVKKDTFSIRSFKVDQLKINNSPADNNKLTEYKIDEKVGEEKCQGCLPKMLKSKRSKSVPNKIGSLTSIMTSTERDDEDDFSIISSEIDRISINNSMMAAESLISFEDEIYHEIDEFPQTAKADFSCEESCEPYSNDLLDDIYKKNNLLEEIEHDLARKFSFKKTISGLYSVAMYRTQVRTNRVIVERDEPISTEQQTLAKADDFAYLNITENLKEKLLCQKRLAEQAARVIHLKKTDQSQKLKAIRSYISCALTYKAVKNEISKWQMVQNFYEIYDQESGFACISDINICIEKPVLDSYFFVLAAVERETVRITEIKEASGKKEDLQDIFEFDNLRQDFIIEMFLYAISLKVKPKHSFLRMSSERLLNKKKGVNKMLNKVNSSNHNIKQLGTCQIHSFNMNNKHWQMKSTHRHLSQNVSLNFDCKVYVEPPHSGFLDLKYQGEEVEVNLRVWSRFWFQLAGADLKGWPYPSDANLKDPSRLISLAQCVSKEVKPASKTICVRPNVFTFSLKLFDGNSQQILCAADSSDEMKLWCYQINKIIKHYKKCNES